MPSCWRKRGAVPPAVYSELTRLFLKSNTAQMPPAFEHGLAEFFTTFEVSGIHITVGAPPPRPDLDWARVHLLVVDPEYSGKLRVLLYNLRKGVDQDAGLPQCVRQVRSRSRGAGQAPFRRRELPDHLAFQPAHDGARFPGEAHLRRGCPPGARGPPGGQPIGGRVRAACFATASKWRKPRKGSACWRSPAIATTKRCRHFAASIEAASASARCYIEYAKLEPDDAKAMQALLRAAGINPKLDEPFALMARRDTDPQKRLAHWKAAAERNPRDPSYWQALAECYLADHNYAEAAKAWKEGEQAATDPAQRERMRQARMAIEQQRLDYEEADRKRRAEEEARAIDKLKTQARAELHAIENKYNDGTPKPSDKAVPWWDGPNPAGKLAGTLKQVDCLGSQARLVVEGDGHQTVKLLVTDPRKVAIMRPRRADAGLWSAEAAARGH